MPLGYIFGLIKCKRVEFLVLTEYKRFPVGDGFRIQSVTIPIQSLDDLI